jgi:threonine dehydrogenase-like Zn-dependent dehydrogenase
MKAAVVHGKNDIRIETVPTPVPGEGEVLVKVRGSGVCATDVKILGGNGLPKSLPTILGHEVAGEIASIGGGVRGLREGQRVVVYPIAVCNDCFFCETNRLSLCPHQTGLAHGVDGGFAEYVLIPERIVALGGVIDIGDLPFDLAAMTEPLSCCIATAEQCSTHRRDTVLVVGCGPMGLLHIIVSKAIGARVIAADVNASRLAKAEELGADVTVDPSQTDITARVRDITGHGADVVIAAVGATRVVEQSLPLVRNGGIFNIFAGTPAGETISVDPRWLHYGEVILTGTFAASLYQFRASLDFIRSNSDAVSAVISSRVRLDDVLDAVEKTRSGQALKSVILFE